MSAWIPIKNNLTGEVRMYFDSDYAAGDFSLSNYMWSEGNWGCDCNRHLYFCRLDAGFSDEDDIEDVDCGEVLYSIDFAYLPDGAKEEIDGGR